MTEEVENKKVKILSWDFVKSRTGMLIIGLILIVGFLLWWILRNPGSDTSKDALIEQQQKEIEVLQKANKDEADFRALLLSKIGTMEQAINKKETEKVRIYERIQNNINHYDTASREAIQSFFDNRYPTKP